MSRHADGAGGAELVIAPARSPEDLDHVRDLMRAFVAWHGERNVADLHLVDDYFSGGAFAEELRDLPGAYAPPRGELLVARYAGEVAGCVAMRPVDAATCEMKRMFVPTRHQGHGIGRALAVAIIAAARSGGYATMLLDTSVRQVEALALYADLGFVEVDPDPGMPAELHGWLVFRRLAL